MKPRIASTPRTRSRLGSLFQAKSLALVGATERSFWSNAAFRNCVDLGFEGYIHVVNTKGGLVYGQTAARSCAAIGEPVDVALLMLPSAALPEALEDLEVAGIHHAVVLSSGYAEAGADGAARQRRLAELAQAHGITLLGPNCPGFINYLDRVPVWTAALHAVIPGSVAIVSQSGATASCVCDFAAQQGLGIGYVVSTGNEGGLTAAQVLDFLVDDPRVRVVALFIEAIRDTEIMIEAARRAREQRKVLIALKVGMTLTTARAAVAQTGSLVGDDRLFSAACRRYGIIRVHSIEELVATAELVSNVVLPARQGLGLAAISGGICEIAADRAAAVGAPLREFAEATRVAIAGLAPEFVAAQNPLDVSGAAAVDPALLEGVVAAMARDPGIGLVLVMFDMPQERHGLVYEMLRRIAAAAAQSETPVVLISTTVRPMPGIARAIAGEVGVTCLGCGIEHGLAAVAHAFRLAADRASAASRRAEPIRPFAGERPVSGRQTLDFLARNGVPVVPGRIVHSADDAMREAARVGGPVVMTIESPDIAQQRDIGCVALDFADPARVSDAFDEILSRARSERPDARIDGVQVACLRRPGLELYIGVLRDPQWGPSMIVGLGGVWLDVLRDASVSLLPVTEEDVLGMLAELRGSRRLDGLRGARGVDRSRLARVIAGIGRAALMLGPRLISLEVNPLAVDDDRIEVLEASTVWDREP